MNIYVGNLPFSASEDDLRQAFGKYGTVGEVNLIRDQFSGRLRGFGLSRWLTAPKQAQQLRR